jgi:hypothetical protein
VEDFYSRADRAAAVHRPVGVAQQERQKALAVGLMTPSAAGEGEAAHLLKSELAGFELALDVLIAQVGISGSGDIGELPDRVELDLAAVGWIETEILEAGHVYQLGRQARAARPAGRAARSYRW